MWFYFFANERKYKNAIRKTKGLNQLLLEKAHTHKTIKQLLVLLLQREPIKLLILQYTFHTYEYMNHLRYSIQGHVISASQKSVHLLFVKSDHFLGTNQKHKHYI